MKPYRESLHHRKQIFNKISTLTKHMQSINIVPADEMSVYNKQP